MSELSKLAGVELIVQQINGLKRLFWWMAFWQGVTLVLIGTMIILYLLGTENIF